ncbi:MAG TPA: hypothetical protein PLL64_04175 [Rhodothermales bacterium]|nr:hypothetical protein [Rhodothermales bacterium]HRR07277.1 hypothetical protein [Rhodothermales bacterium]
MFCTPLEDFQGLVIVNRLGFARQFDKIAQWLLRDNHFENHTTYGIYLGETGGLNLNKYKYLTGRMVTDPYLVLLQVVDPNFFP